MKLYTVYHYHYSEYKMSLVPIIRRGVWTCFNKNSIHTWYYGDMWLTVLSNWGLKVYEVTADLLILVFLFFFCRKQLRNTTCAYMCIILNLLFKCKNTKWNDKAYISFNVSESGPNKNIKSKYIFAVLCGLPHMY